MGNCCSSRNNIKSDIYDTQDKNREPNINENSKETYTNILLNNIKELDNNIRDIKNTLINNNLFKSNITMSEQHSSNIKFTTQHIPIKRRNSKTNQTTNIPNELGYIKKLNNCHDSQVYLLNNNIVLKRYPKSRSGSGQFTNEIATYRLLFNCPFILNIINLDFSNNSFTIPFISGKPIKNSHNRDVVDRYLQILDKSYGLERLYPISWTNLVCDNKKIYLIDFGGVPINYNPGGKLKWKFKNIRNNYK